MDLATGRDFQGRPLPRKLFGLVEGDSDAQVFIPQLIALYKNGQLPFDRLIQKFPFEQINEAMAASESGAVIKPVVVF